MKSKIMQWLAIVLSLETGLLHLLTSQGWFLQAPYVGYLFLANFLACLVAAYGIYRQQFWGWALGLVISLGSILGYVWSRTLGLPGTVVEAWFSPVGLVALAVESLFILLMLFRPWRSLNQSPAAPLPALLRDLLPSAGLLVIVLISFSALQWTSALADAVSPLDGHIHPGSLGELCRTPLTSFAQFEEQYGVRVIQVAVSALNSIVDVRFKIVDAKKAHALFDYHAALLVDQQALILAPHMHHHDKLISGGSFVIFFPTQRNTVHTGSSVSLVLGSLRLEPLIVQ